MLTATPNRRLAQGHRSGRSIFPARFSTTDALRVNLPNPAKDSSSTLRAALPPTAHLAAVLVAFGVTAAVSTRWLGTVSPIWYSNAILLVALLLHPVRTWPAFLLPAFAVDTAVFAIWGSGPALLLAAVDIGEALVAAVLVERTGGLRMPLYANRQVVRVLLACMAAPLLSASVGATMLSVLGEGAWTPIWVRWYWSSVLGLVIGCCLGLGWADPRLRYQVFRRFDARHLLALAAGAALAIFFAVSDEAWLLLSFPVLVALTWVYGLLGVTVGVVGISFATLWVTLHGEGALVHMTAHTDVGERVEAVQVYLAAVLLSSLPLSILRARQRELTDDLKRASEARSEFLAAMSHEIRTPMTGVLGMVDLLAAEQLSAQQRGYVESMRSSGRHLLSIINDVLDFTRIESGKLELEDIDFALPEVLETLRSLVNPLAVERGLALAIELPPGTPHVLRGDPLRLRQVLLNLASNAIKFTEKGGVTVAVSHRPRTDAPGWWMRFEVRDTGIGIAPEKLRQLFAPFTQADRSISRQYGGSGLGLAISKRLVQAMDGTIGASSRPGEGSVFHLEVPLPPGDPANLADEAKGAATEVAPQRILVAEDVEVNRAILRAALEREGHQVAFAHDGAQAVALVQREPFDLVLMDVQMPVMDGVEATRRIRRMPPPLRDIPILGLTANVMAHEREKYLGAGMDECLHKPVEWDRLYAAIAQHAGGRVPATAPAPTAAPAPSALIDEGTFDALRQMIDDNDQLTELVRIATRDYERCCEAMAAPGATAPEVRREAHRLKGSAGTLGLAALSALAGDIEQRAEAGDTAGDAIRELRALVAASRDELKRRGLVTDAA